MHVDAHKEVDNFVLTYLSGEGVEEDQYLAAITRKVDADDGLDAVHYFPREQSTEISRYALTRFYRSKFSEGLEEYNEKRNLTSTGYELLSQNIGNEDLTPKGDPLVEENGLDEAFEMLDRGRPVASDGGFQMSDAEKAARKADHFY